jgi:FecR protein/Putative zinc-finger
MFGNHVTSLSSLYFHGELPPRENSRVAEHLLACTSCRAEFDAIKSGIKLAEKIELITAPASIWTGIATQLDKKPTRRETIWFLKPAIIAFLIVVAVSASLLWLRNNRIDPGGQWNVARLGGAPRIDSKTIGNDGKLGVGQWLETDATSRAKIDVATIGRVEIDPNSRVRLLETNSQEHRLELQRGRLSAVISAPPKLFFVNTPSGVAEDLGCAYTLEVDDHGNSLLHVTTGWVSLQLNGRESAVPAGAACATRAGVGPGTPYFEDASESFRAALTKVDFEPATAPLETLLHQARQRDAMTLWYLMARVDASRRALVYTRLAELVPPPRGTTKDGLMALDSEMLKLWRDEIDKALGNLSRFGSAHSTWRLIWSDALGRIRGLQGKK